MERRRNWTSCFPTRAPKEDWQSDYVGVITLANGTRYWARLWSKTDKNGKPYFSLNLKSQDPDAS
jgi:hypothetical protein